MLAGDSGRSRRQLIHDPSAYAVLAASLGLSGQAFEDEVAARAAYLTALLDRGICDPVSVAAAVTEYPALPEGAIA